MKGNTFGIINKLDMGFGVQFLGRVVEKVVRMCKVLGLVPSNPPPPPPASPGEAKQMCQECLTPPFLQETKSSSARIVFCSLLSP